MIIKWLVVALFALLLVVLSIGSLVRTKTYTDFNLAGRRVGLARLVGSLGAAEFNTATLIGAASVSYLYGTVGIWYTSIVFIVVFGVYTVTVAKPYRRLQVSTIAEFFERRYSGKLAEPTRALASVLTGIFTWMAPATYMAGLTVVVSVMLGVQPLAAVVVITLFCLVLALMGGFMTAVTFDVVAYGTILLMVPVLFIVGYVNAGGFNALPEVYEARFLSFKPVWDIEDYGFAAILTWGFQTTLLYIAAPWYGQRIFSAKNERVAFTAMGINTVLLVVLYALIAVTTMFSRVLLPGLERPEEALPLLAVEYLPVIAQALVLVMLILVGTSTIMAIWNAGVSIMINDILRRYMAPNKTDKFYISMSRLAFVGLAVVTLVFALSMIGNILIVLTYVGVAAALLAFPILAGLYWRRFSTNAAFWSLVLSTVYVVIALIVGLPYHMISPIGVAIGVAVGLAITFWGPSDDDAAQTEAFFLQAWTPSDANSEELEDNAGAQSDEH